MTWKRLIAILAALAVAILTFGAVYAALRPPQH